MKKSGSGWSFVSMRFAVLFLVICAAGVLAGHLLLSKPQAQNKSVVGDLSGNEPLFARKTEQLSNRISQMIETQKSGGAIFRRRELFAANARLLSRADNLGGTLEEGVILNLDRTAVENVKRENPLHLVLPIADGRGGAIELELTQVNIFAPGFSVETSKATGETYEGSLGIHYRGIVKGDSRSIASVSIFKTEVMAIFSTEATGNVVLGRLGGKNPIDRHILYNDRDLKNRPNFSCRTEDNEAATLPEPPPQTEQEFIERCVRIYVEAGYDLFQNKGTVAATAGYIAGFFNQSATLFATTGVNTRLSKVFVWNSPSPFNEATTGAQLQAFYNLRKTFNGDIAQLVDLRFSGAGIAHINAYCGAGSDRRHGYTGIFPDYEPVPTFSNTVFLFSHEVGHNLGSQHTHACRWNDTAIDGCAAVEGACPNPGLPPPNGGTIMSYCPGVVGVSFALGYGPQPSARILERYNAAACLTDCASTVVPKRLFDFDGDRRADVSVYRPSTGIWYIQQSTVGFAGYSFGADGDLIVPADFDGDDRTDLAVFRSTTGTWYVQQSTAGFAGYAFGASGDVPVPADYDNDGKADLAVFRPSTGAWYLQQTSAGFIGIVFGANGDMPVAADYDGDGKADIAVFRPSTGVWYIQRSSLGFTGIAFGANGDKVVPADYDGDGKADVAVFRPSNGVWYLLQSTAGFTGAAFGLGTDLPAPADYDSDGKTDIAVFRDGTWYLQRSTAGFTGVTFGAGGDKPIPNAFVR
jgi:hypothetical protein